MTRQSNHASETPSSPDTSISNLSQQLLDTLPVTERRLSLNGVRTAVLEGGEGPAVVLLHGPGGYASQWLRVIPDLVRTHRVIAPDLPGHGSSGLPEGPLDRNRILGWLDDLIDCTCDTPPVLVGHVIGGAIAARFAAERGDRLSSLVLVDSLGLVPFQPAPEFGQALGAFMSEPTQDNHDQLWKLCSHDLDALRDALGERWQWIKACNIEGAGSPELAGAMQGLMEEFGMPAIPGGELERISVPTRLIWGKHDLATPVAVAKDVGSRYGWPVDIIEGAADDPSLDRPEEFLAALRCALTG